MPHKLKPDERRARLLIIDGEKFISVRDVARHLTEDDFVKMCAEILDVGQKMNAPWVESLRRTIGCAVMILAGDEEWARKEMEAEKN